MTPEQEARLAELDKKFGGMDPDKEARFAELDAKFGGLPELPTSTETAGRAFAQGATLNTSDEIAGFLPFLHSLLSGSRVTEEDKGRFENALNAYRMVRDEERAKNKAAAEANPGVNTAFNLAGGALPAVLTGGSTAALAGTGAVMGAGESEADVTKGEGGKLAGDALVGAGTAALLGKVLEKFPTLGKALKEEAYGMAEKATGATGKFAEKNFKPGTGKRLLEGGDVRFFDSPATIAERVQGKMDVAGKAMDEAILSGERSGASVSRDHLLKKLKGMAGAMKDDQAPVARKLLRIIDDIEAGRPNVNARYLSAVEKEIAPLEESLAGKNYGDLSKLPGVYQPPIEGEISGEVSRLAGLEGKKEALLAKPDIIPLSKAENIKRGFYAQSNYTKPYTTEATKAAGRAIKEEVEDALLKSDPAIAKKFKEAKEAWGFFSPVEQAASGRATQLNQSPIGGLLDTAAMGVGELVTGHPLTAVGTAVARRTFMPRMAASLASVEHTAGKALAHEIPSAVKNIMAQKGSKYATILLKAEQEGPQKLAVTDYVLSHSDPEYARLRNENKETE